jgi:hypothetical protein
MRRIPISDETAPIACTISTEEIPARVELIERLRANLDGLDRSEHGLLLRFPNRAEVAGDLRRFVVDEKRCCEFWGFEITTTDEALRLRWEAPPDGQGLIDRLLAFFRGDEPALDLAGLL